MYVCMVYDRRADGLVQARSKKGLALKAGVVFVVVLSEQRVNQHKFACIRTQKPS